MLVRRLRGHGARVDGTSEVSEALTVAAGDSNLETVPSVSFLPHPLAKPGEQLHARASVTPVVAVPMRRPASTSKG